MGRGFNKDEFAKEEMGPMKKGIMIGVSIVLVVLIILSFFFFNDVNTLERKLHINLPQEAQITQFYRELTLTEGRTVAAKVEMSKEEYSEFVAAMPDYFYTFDPADYDGDNLDEYAPPYSNDFFNIEKYREGLSWWDAEVEEITFMYYLESYNWRRVFGVRHHCVRKIYVVETSDAVTLYLYYWQ